MRPRLAVFVEVALGLEGKAASLTGIRSLVGVGADVLVQHAGFGTHQLTVGTDIFLFAAGKLQFQVFELHLDHLVDVLLVLLALVSHL